MLIQKAGITRNTLKIAQTDRSRQQKKQQEEKKAKQEMDPELKQIMQYQEDIQRMREGNEMHSVLSKIKSGAELAPEEIEYLKKNSPDSYKQYEEIKAEKKAYEQQLKACKSQEDVEKLKLNKAGQFMAETKSVANNPNIPKAKKLEMLDKLAMRFKNILEVHAEFIKSGQYDKLPADEEIKEAIENVSDAGQLPVEEREAEETNAKQQDLKQSVLLPSDLMPSELPSKELTLPELKVKSEAVIAETLKNLKKNLPALQMIENPLERASKE